MDWKYIVRFILHWIVLPLVIAAFLLGGMVYVNRHYHPDPMATDGR